MVENERDLREAILHHREEFLLSGEMKAATSRKYKQPFDKKLA
jgi:hypothetical protein